MVNKTKLDPQVYRISFVNCYRAEQPSSDDFDFPGYRADLRIPPKIKQQSFSEREKSSSQLVSVIG